MARPKGSPDDDLVSDGNVRPNATIELGTSDLKELAQSGAVQGRASRVVEDDDEDDAMLALLDGPAVIIAAEPAPLIPTLAPAVRPPIVPTPTGTAIVHRLPARSAKSTGTQHVRRVSTSHPIARAPSQSDAPSSSHAIVVLVYVVSSAALSI